MPVSAPSTAEFDALEARVAALEQATPPTARPYGSGTYGTGNYGG